MLCSARSALPAALKQPFSLGLVRYISEEQLNASQDHLDELFQRTLQNASRKKPEGRPVLTTRREALCLYREVLRYSNLYVWKDNQGRVWRDVIRSSTRKVCACNVHADACMPLHQQSPMPYNDPACLCAACSYARHLLVTPHHAKLHNQYTCVIPCD